jgi:glycosyltransferase involved in cell wall biosynthesis
MKKIKIAIFHDYLNQYGGAERVLEELLTLYPEADIYTFIYDDAVLPQFKKWRVITSPVQYLPFSKQHYQYYLWLFPLVIKLFNFRRYDLVVVSTHAWGNGIRKAGAKMITYCHTPMRYVWDLYDDYVQYRFVPSWMRLILAHVRPFLQSYDKQCSRNPDAFVVNSAEVRERVRNNYGRSADVIHPPVKVDFFSARDHVHNGGYYLVVTRLKPYKRVDLIIEAFNQFGKRLVIVGDGPEKKKLARLAQANIEFVDNVSDESLRELYAGALGYVHMAHEDFGMSMAEAQAAGTPVIAYSKGGAREIVRDKETGILFHEQTAAALVEALRGAISCVWDRALIRNNAGRFAAAHFKKQFAEITERILDHV